MKDHIRRAQESDLPVLIELAEQKRVEYEKYLPWFWRRAKDAPQKHAPYLKGMLEKKDCLPLVLERDDRICGFIIGQLVPAPPVYDPGGPTCYVDDFVVEKAEDWDTMGRALLDELAKLAGELGAVQAMVLCAQRDQAKRSMLKPSFAIATEVWVKPIKRSR